tara:strand:+ start:6147 stop:6401 length:255 start_codon:yes stop_codon:yes gene_type:complete
MFKKGDLVQYNGLGDIEYKSQRSLGMVVDIMLVSEIVKGQDKSCMIKVTWCHRDMESIWYMSEAISRHCSNNELEITTIGNNNE